MRTPTFRLLSVRRLALASLLAAGASAHAATYTWDGGGTDGNWTTAANWQGNIVPPSSQDTALLFAGNKQLAPNQNVGSFFMLNSLAFDTSAGAFTLGGNRIDFSTSSSAAGSLAPTLVQNSSALETINDALRFNSTVTVSGSGNLLLGGAITGSGNAPGLTMAGTGTLTLTGNSNGTYAGVTTLQSGVLDVGSAGALGNSGTIDFAGGTLQYSAANQTDYSSRFSTAAGQQYNIDTNGQNVTFASALTGSGGNLSKLGGGTLTLAGVNTYTGETIVSAGTLAITGSVTSSDELMVDSASMNAAAPTLTLSGTNSSLSISVNAFVGFYANGAVNQTGGTFTEGEVFYLGYYGNGTYDLSGTGSLNAGGVDLGYNVGSSGTFTQTGGTFTLASGAPLYLGYYGNGTYDLSGTGSLSAGVTYVGFYDSGAVNQTGGTFTTNGKNLYLGYHAGSSGVYDLGGGTLTAGRVVGGGGTSEFDFNGGTLQASVSDNPGAASSPTTFFIGLTTADVQAGGAIIDTQSYNVTVASGLTSGVASGTDGGLTKLGTGTLTLTGANTYNGATTISAGTLQVGNGGTVGSLGTGAVNDNSALTFNHSDNVTVANAIGGTGGLTQAGGGTLTLTGANTYTGSTNVSGGTLSVAGSGSLTGGGAINVNAGATLGIGGTANVSLPNAVLTVDGANGTAANAVLAGGTLSTSSTYVGYTGLGTFNQTGGTLTYGNLFDIGIAQNSQGTYTQSGGTVNTSSKYGMVLGLNSGSQGTYNLGGTGQFNANAGLIVGNSGAGTFNQTGGTLASNVYTVLLGANANGSGTYTLGNGVLQGAVQGGKGASTFNFDGGTLQAPGSTSNFMQSLGTANVQAGGAFIDTPQNFSDIIAQNLVHDTTVGAANIDGGLTKLGSGTLTLTGNNTFTGPLTISAGTLLAASEASLGTGGTLTVGGGGTLGFTGTAATLTRTYNLGFSSLTAASGQTLTFGGGASVNGGFVGGPGTLAFGDGSTLNAATTTLNSTATASGTVTFNNDALRGQLTQTSGTINASDTVVSPSGTLVVGGTVNANGMEIDGVTTVNNGGTLNGTVGSLVFGGGARATINTGGTLAAANGTTVELNGALLVNNGTQSGTLDVNYGSTAKGSGTFGTVNVADGGRFGVNATGAGGGSASVMMHGISAGAGLTQPALVAPMLAVVPGTARVTSLSLGSGSIFALNVQDAQGAAGSGYDTARVGGVLTLNSFNTLGEQITISLVSLGTNGAAGPAANFDASHSYDFVLASADGGISGYAPGEFVVDTTGFQNALDGGAFSVVQSGNDLDLMFNPVPEPATWILLGIGGVWLGVAVLRRRHHAG